MAPHHLPLERAVIDECLRHDHAVTEALRGEIERSEVEGISPATGSSPAAEPGDG